MNEDPKTLEKLLPKVEREVCTSELNCWKTFEMTGAKLDPPPLIQLGQPLYELNELFISEAIF